MADHSNNQKEDEGQEVMPSRKRGAFEFMADHLFDLVVIIRTEENDPRLLRRVELYYAERGMISSFVFDRSSKKFNKEAAKAIPAAMDQLITEVKSRSLSHHSFTVWYYSEEDRALVEKYAQEHAEDSRTQRKHLKALKENSMLISEAEEPEDTAAL